MDGQLAFAFPRPGPALKIVLVLVAALGLTTALLVNWTPFGVTLFTWLACASGPVLHGQLWRLVTAGLLTSPSSLSHLVFTLIGLYFLSPDLERRWGSWRFARFLVVATVVGFALAIVFDVLAPAGAALFHPRLMFGASAAITATAIAWSRINANMQVRLFFFLPVSGRALFWVTIGFCVLGLLYQDTFTEGAVAPFGGVLTGLLLTGNPSPLRALYLRLKLARLRGRVGPGVPTAHDIATGATTTKKRRGGPPLRVVYGGLEDELKKRKPPKDKRYLN